MDRPEIHLSTLHRCQPSALHSNSRREKGKNEGGALDVI